MCMYIHTGPRRNSQRWYICTPRQIVNRRSTTSHQQSTRPKPLAATYNNHRGSVLLMNDNENEDGRAKHYETRRTSRDELHFGLY